MEKSEIRKWILYEDGEILVVRKPAGIAVESANVMQADLHSRLRFYMDGAAVYIVHRLDQPVEGVLVFAKTKQAAAALSAQLADGTMTKLYTARVSGVIPKTEDTLVDYLVKDRKTNQSKVVQQPENVKDTPTEAKPEGGRAAGPAGSNSKSAAQAEDSGKAAEQADRSGTAAVKAGNSRKSTEKRKRIDTSPKKGENTPKRAVLHYKKIGEREVEIRLETGRHHQIRVQLSHAGMPIFGDRKYGGEAWPRLCLCASSLTFRHPKSGKEMTFSVKAQFDSQTVRNGV